MTCHYHGGVGWYLGGFLLPSSGSRSELSQPTPSVYTSPGRNSPTLLKKGEVNLNSCGAIAAFGDCSTMLLPTELTLSPKGK